MNAKTPVALITGFLGSGKTTLLRRVIRHYRGRPMAYLVNEFSAIDVDGKLLAEEGEPVYALPGGSIFCSCLVTDFVKVMAGLPEYAPETGFDGLVIEASGIANPLVFERMLRETQLDKLYALASVTTVVDPGTLPVLLQTLPATKAQIEAADALVLNKVDLCGPEAVVAARQAVSEINPKARMQETVHCELSFGPEGLELLPEPEPREAGGDYARCADPAFARFVLRPPGETDLDALRAAFERLRPLLYRAKGFVNTGGQAHYVDFSPAALTIKAAPEHVCVSELVVIARGEHRAEVDTWARAVKSRGFAEAE